MNGFIKSLPAVGAKHRTGRLLPLVLLGLVCGGVSCKRSAVESQPPGSQPDAGQPSAAAPQPEGTAGPEAHGSSGQVSSTGRSGSLSTNRYVYNGYFKFATNSTKALIKDIILRRGSVAQEGDEVFGFKVRSITPDLVTLTRDGMEYRLPLNTNVPPALAAPGFNPSNFPPGFIQTSTSTNPVIPAAPPPVSQTVQPIRPDQIPAAVSTQLQQRLQQKAAQQK